MSLWLSDEQIYVGPSFLSHTWEFVVDRCNVFHSKKSGTSRTPVSSRATIVYLTCACHRHWMGPLLNQEKEMGTHPTTRVLTGCVDLE